MKFRVMIRKYIINNIGYKILAVVFSFVLWLVILNITDPEYTRTLSNFEVQILNEDKVLDGNHVYTIASGATTSVFITGKRSILSTLSPNDFLVTADFEELSITNAVPIKVELTGEKSRYSGQITVTPKDTSMIINLEDMTSKQIYVELESRGSLPEGIVLEETNISPKKVTMNAPESVADAADKAVVIADYGVIDSDMTVVLNPEIRGFDGTVIKQTGETSLEETDITVEFKVSYKKNVPIVVHSSGEVAEGYVLRDLTLSQDAIVVKGSKENISLLQSVHIPDDLVDVTGASESFDTVIDVMQFLPEGIVVYGESPTFTVTAEIVSQEEYEAELESLAQEETSGE